MALTQAELEARAEREATLARMDRVLASGVNHVEEDGSTLKRDLRVLRQERDALRAELATEDAVLAPTPIRQLRVYSSRGY